MKNKSTGGKRERKKSPLYIGKENYGSIPMGEAFKKALEPYFNESIKTNKKDKN